MSRSRERSQTSSAIRDRIPWTDGENPQPLSLPRGPRAVLLRARGVHVRAADRAYLEAGGARRQPRRPPARHPEDVLADPAGLPRGDRADGALVGDSARLRTARVGQRGRRPQDFGREPLPNDDPHCGVHGTRLSGDVRDRDLGTAMGERSAAPADVRGREEPHLGGLQREGVQRGLPGTGDLRRGDRARRRHPQGHSHLRCRATRKTATR